MVAVIFLSLTVSNAAHRLYLSDTGLCEDACLDAADGSGRSDALPLHVGQEVASRARKTSAIAETVCDAVAAKVFGAGTHGRARWHEDLAGRFVGRDGGLDVLEDIAFNEDVCTRCDVESMAGVVGPVVVDHVPDRVELKVRRATGSGVDVVALECNEIGITISKDGPVVMTIAGRRRGGLAIEVVVSDRDAVRSFVSGNKELSSNQRELCDRDIRHGTKASTKG